MKFVGYSVGMKCLVFMRNLSISEWMSVTCPQPTVVRSAFIDILPELFSERHRSLMVINVSLWLAFYYARLSVAFLGNRRGLTTAAHAQAAWIGAFGEWLLKHIVSEDEFDGLAFDVSVLGASSCGNVGKLTTATSAITVGNILRGIIEGHEKFTFLVPKPGVIHSRRQALSIGVLPEYFSTNERFMQREKAFSMAGLPIFA